MVCEIFKGLGLGVNKVTRRGRPVGNKHYPCKLHSFFNNSFYMTFNLKAMMNFEGGKIWIISRMFKLGLNSWDSLLRNVLHGNAVFKLETHEIPLWKYICYIQLLLKKSLWQLSRLLLNNCDGFPYLWGEHFSLP